MTGTAPSPDAVQVVLITEADSGFRGALEFLLRIEGYQVLAIENGEALLDLALPERDACLVLDQDLPGLSGLATIEALRGRGIDLPAVLLAARRADFIWWLRAQKRIQVVEKPLLGDAIVKAVATAFDASRPSPSCGP